MLYKRYAQVTHPLDERIYDVYFSLCCKSVKTLQGSAAHGHRNIAFNQDLGGFVCSKNDKKTAPKKRMAKRLAQSLKDADKEDCDDDDSSGGGEDDSLSDEELFDEEELNLDEILNKVAALSPGAATADKVDTTDNRYQRKDFHFIPCNNQPVLRINLLGYALQYGSARYCHCVQCAGLFRQEFHFNRRCNGCISRDPAPTYTCAVCNEHLTEEQARDCLLQVSCAVSDPFDPAFSPIERGDSTDQLLYFCKRHLAAAKSRVHSLDKRDLLSHISRVQDRQNVRSALFSGRK